MPAELLNRARDEGVTIIPLLTASTLWSIFKNSAIGIIVVIPAIILWAALHCIAPGVPPFVTFFPAVVAAAVIGGQTTGCMAALVCLAAVDFRWFDCALSLHVSTQEKILTNALFLLSVSLILWVTSSLRAALDRTAAYLDVAGNLLLIIGSDGTVRHVNRQGVTILGYRSSAELVGKDWFDICIPDHLQKQARAAFQKALADGQLGERESMIVRPDGTQRTIKWHFVALKGQCSGTHGLLASGVDMTESRKTLEALVRNEARLNAVLRQFPGAVSILERPHGKVVSSSNRSSAILGHPVLDFDTIEGLANYGGLHEDGRPYAAQEYPIARALLSGEEVNGEMLRYRRPDDRIIDLEVYAAPIRGESGDIVAAVGIALDVSNRVEAERKLRQREDALQNAVEAREMLIREAEHRIKNSLQMVIGMLTMQRKSVVDPLAADAIESSIARVGAIAEAHFALQQSADLRQVDLGAMLKEVSTRLASLREETALQCIFEGNLTISADQAIPTALMVSELLTNSLRHAYPPGTSGKIVIIVKNLAGHLTVTVTDDGIGIPDTAKRRKGLGSRLIGMFAQQVGGEMLVSSPPGGGTTASITMPIAELGELR